MPKELKTYRVKVSRKVEYATELEVKASSENIASERAIKQATKLKDEDWADCIYHSVEIDSLEED